LASKEPRRRTIPLLVTLAFCLLLSSCTGGGPAERPPLSRPNVLVLVIDCLRTDHVGINGYHRQTTPAIDSLAAEGVSFTQAISPSSWTRPTMPALLTGLYPSENGLIELERDENGGVIGPIMSPEVDTLAEKLKRAGYATALFGEQFQLSHRFGLAQGFDVYKNQIGGAERIHRRFTGWLDEAKPGRFFTLLHYFDIHWPYCPPPSARGSFGRAEGTIDFCRQSRKLRRQIRHGEVTVTEADRLNMIALYDEELLYLDRMLADFFYDLRQRGLWDDLLIILTSDHGEEFLEHGSVGHKNSLYEELIRVPLVIKPPADWPMEKRGVLNDALVESLDLTATIEEAAGLPVTSSSESLVPWLVQPREAQPRDFTVSESHAFVAVRTTQSKLILSRTGSEEVLYDLEADPAETKNLAPERPDEVERLKGFLARWQSGLRVTEPLREAVDDRTQKGLRAIGYLD
jgi:choline-sulfatase